MLQSVFDTTVFATTFTTLLVIQDPLGAIPIFLSLTSRQTPPERAASARQATVVSFAVIVLFAVFGRYILKFLGISVPSLQVAGGLLLLLVALELLTDKVDESPDPEAVTANAALVPLGTPLLAGPGAIVAAMVAVDTTGGGVAGWVSVTAAIIGTHIAIWAALRFSLGLNRVLGTSGSWTSSSIMSDGSYGVPEGIISSFPCTSENGEWKIVQGIEIDDFSRAKIDASAAELVEEKNAVASMGLI